MPGVRPDLHRLPKRGRRPHFPERQASSLYLAARYFWKSDRREQSEKHRHFLPNPRPGSNLRPGLGGSGLRLPPVGRTGTRLAHQRQFQGQSAALQAIELDETLAEAHAAQAVIFLDYHWDFAGAEGAFQRALELKPDYAIAHQLYGKCLACMGRHTEAIAAIRRAQELQPLSTIFSATLGRHGFFYARRYDEAIREFRKMIETDPTFWIVHYFLGWAYVFRGNLPEALTAFATASRLDDNPETLVGPAYAYAVAGQPTKAKEALDALTELARHRYVRR